MTQLLQVQLQPLRTWENGLSGHNVHVSIISRSEVEVEMGLKIGRIAFLIPAQVDIYNDVCIIRDIIT